MQRNRVEHDSAAPEGQRVAGVQSGNGDSRTHHVASVQYGAAESHTTIALIGLDGKKNPTNPRLAGILAYPVLEGDTPPRRRARE